MRAPVLVGLVGTFLGLGSAPLVAAEPIAGVSDDGAEAALATPIIYRGQLSFLDIPVTTSVDLRFRFYALADGGERLGREIGLDGIDLDEGAFEAVLDFGVTDPTGWIEIDVRAPSADGAFTTLSPRQRVDSALIAADAPAGSTAEGDPRALTEQGVSTSTSLGGESPATELDASIRSATGGERGLTGGAPVSSLEQTSSGGPRGGWVMSGSNISFVGGNVGIGTAAPNAPLHVVGTGSRVARIINTPANGSGWGLFAEANGNASRAIFGRANRTVGQNFGVFGQSLSSRGTGVFGQANATAGITYGVTGVSRAASGTGVRGLATNAGGSTVAVLGQVTSSSGLAGNFLGGKGVEIDKGTTGTADPALRINGGQLYLFEQSGGSNFANIGYIDFGGGNDGLVLTADGDIRMFAIGGGVGVGRAAAANAFEVQGQASKSLAGLWLANSDARIKTDIQPVTNALDTLDRVRLVSFEYDDRYRADHPVIKDTRYLNVIAQEFAEVFPEHVQGSGEFLADGSEILQVDTYPLIIYSAAATQELRGVVEKQESRIRELEHRLMLLEQVLLGETP